MCNRPNLRRHVDYINQEKTQSNHHVGEVQEGRTKLRDFPKLVGYTKYQMQGRKSYPKIYFLTVLQANKLEEGV
jgi:hypothetical protein